MGMGVGPTVRPWLLLTLGALAWILPLGARAAPTARPSPFQRQRFQQALQAAAALSRGRPAGALVVLEQARQRRDSAALATAAALCRVLQGDLRGARKTLAEATALGGTWLDAHYYRAVLALRAGRFDEARDALHHATTLGGQRPHFAMLSALLARRQGQGARARAALGHLARRRCDLLDPRLYPDPLAGAAEALGHLLRAFPRPAAAQTTVGNVLWAGHRYRRAEDHYQRARRRRPHNAAVLLRVARARLTAGDVPHALRLVTRGIAAAPGAAALRALRAELSLHLGRPAAARADLERAVRADPRAALPLARLANLLWERGAYERAERLYRYALKRDRRLAAARYGLARALDRQRKHEQATAAYRAATRANPANERYHLAFALHLQKRGQTQAAARARARARRAAALSSRAHQRARRAWRAGSALRRICAVADVGGLRAARVMLRRVRLPRAVQAFAQAALAQRAGQPTAAALMATAAALRPGPLLSAGAEPLTVVIERGQVEPDVPVVLKQYLMSVDPARFGDP
jgi:tetratricopeptide (TPR) repeat protein